MAALLSAALPAMAHGSSRRVSFCPARQDNLAPGGGATWGVLGGSPGGLPGGLLPRGSPDMSTVTAQ